MFLAAKDRFSPYDTGTAALYSMISLCTFPRISFPAAAVLFPDYSYLYEY